MARQSEATFDTQAAAIAAALNAALGDTLLTGIAADLKDPNHPLRKWENWVSMSDAGVFTADTDYITQAYANRSYTKSRSTKSDRKTNDPA